MANNINQICKFVNIKFDFFEILCKFFRDKLHFRRIFCSVPQM